MAAAVGEADDRLALEQTVQTVARELRDKAKAAGMDYFLMNTARPLDEGLREYLFIRQGRM